MSPANQPARANFQVPCWLLTGFRTASTARLDDHRGALLQWWSVRFSVAVNELGSSWTLGSS